MAIVNHSLEINGLWEEILRNYNQQFEGYSERLNPPVDATAFADKEKKMGFPLPDELKALYLCNNGDSNQVLGTILGLPFLSFEEMFRHWDMWKVLILGEDEAGMETLSLFSTSKPKQAIKKIYANEKWLPFAYDYANNYIGIDLDPGPSGVVGQIINFGRDEDDKYVLAPSLPEFLKLMLQLQENVTFKVGLNEDDLVQVNWENRGHPIDCLKILIDRAATL